MPELHIGGRVLDEDRALQIVLEPLYVFAHDFERFFRHRQGQQIGEIVSADDAEGEMLGDESRLEPLDGLPHPREVRRVQPLRAAERKPRAVKRHGVVAADCVKVRRGAAAAHVVLDMHLEPRRGRTRFEDFLMVAEAQPDPGLGRDRVASAPV